MSDRVGFVSEPNCGRGTAGILWQCLTTIVFCTYTCLHFQVPRGPAPSKLHVRGWKWILYALLAPEMTLMVAYDNYAGTKYLMRYFHRHGKRSVTIKQASLLNANGVEILIDERPRYPACSRWHADKAIIPLMGGGNLKLDDLINHLPTDAEIDNASKVDSLGKVVTAFQALWTAANIVGRLSVGLDVSLLEASTCASILLALMMTFLWWNKPYNIATPFQIRLPAASLEADLSSVSPDGKSLQEEELEQQVVALRVEELDNTFWNFSDSVFASRYNACVSLSCGGVFFASVHAAAWNYQFPTAIEMWFWRGAAIALGVGAITISAFSWMISEALRTDKMETWRSIIHLRVSALLLYMIARVFIIVEVFLAFRSAPAGIYQQMDWSNYIGHVGG